MPSVAAVQALDLDHRPIREGDQVRFVMRGHFLAREQEWFGEVISIDEFGGIRIRAISSYRHFLSSKKIADYSTDVYFTHHRYDDKIRARIYSIDYKGHNLYIARIDED